MGRSEHRLRVHFPGPGPGAGNTVDGWADLKKENRALPMQLLVRSVDFH